MDKEQWDKIECGICRMQGKAARNLEKMGYTVPLKTMQVATMEVLSAYISGKLIDDIMREAELINEA